MLFNIAIVGAGPAGCMLASLLVQSNQQIAVTIFENEKSLDFRSQGGTLDLHESTGQAALKRANLFEQFKEHARYDGEAMTIADKKLLCYVKQGASAKGSLTGRPEIDRPRLRELLYNALPQGTVKWNKKLLRVDESLTLHFADGTTERGFDLIVGADGAWSKVRSALTDTQPYYSGISGHALDIPDAEKNHPELHKVVNRGSCFTFSDGKSIMAQQMGDGSLNVTTWGVRPQDLHPQGVVKDANATKSALCEEYKDWDPRLVDFIRQASGRIVYRDLYMLPIGHSWKHVPGVTVIGDAAHLATPFAGEGVNTALQDSLRLADAIISAATSKSGKATPSPSPAHQLDKNIADFERDMFERAKAMQQMTFDMMTAMYFTPGAPRKGIERYVIRAVEGEMGPVATKLLVTPLVFIWFFFFKLFRR